MDVVVALCEKDEYVLRDRLNLKRVACAWKKSYTDLEKGGMCCAAS